jgi:cell wall-associated NlpC family hydrolase
MTADFHFFRGDWQRRREDTELNLQLGRFFYGYRIETRIFERGGTSSVDHGAIYRADGKHVADATP